MNVSEDQAIIDNLHDAYGSAFLLLLSVARSAWTLGAASEMEHEWDWEAAVEWLEEQAAAKAESEANNANG